SEAIWCDLGSLDNPAWPNTSCPALGSGFLAAWWEPSGSMATLLDVRGLSRHFGPITAVDNVSFAVQRGGGLGFLGPNGAGKTTTMRMIAGFLAPSSGTVIVCGADVGANPVAVKRRLGYLPEGAPLYVDMTPAGFLEFVASIRGLVGEDRRRRLSAVV